MASLRDLNTLSLSASRKIPGWDGTVQNLVAFPAKRDQVGPRVLSKGAAPSQVVNIEILEAATYLTSPVIARQDLLAQPRIRDGRWADSMPLLRNRVAHVAFSVGSDGAYVAAEQPMNAENSGPCKELSVSNAAPAKKSAQIISSE
jgi:hypothetical protein